MSVSAPVHRRIEAISDQIAYLVDELEAQRPWITRIPEVQLTGRPMDSTPSLLELYVQMATKEWNEYIPLLSGEPSTYYLETDSISHVIDSIQEGRQNVMDLLASLSESDWSAPIADTNEIVLDFAFQITQSDSTFLRSIAERLHESLITFSR